jgi:hypothetical protein
MTVCKRIIAGGTFLLAVLGLLLGSAGGIGVWIVKEPLTERATKVFGRIEVALQLADQGFEVVKTSLARATERLDSAREEQRKLAQEPQRNSFLQRTLARTVQQKIAPMVGDANEKLHKVAESAVVVNSILEDAGNLPFIDVSGFDMDRLAEINSRLAEVGPAAWELSRLLGEPGADADADAAIVQMSRVDKTLQAARGLIAEYEPRLQQVRAKTEHLKSWTLPWITPATVVICFVCFWFALSQISLMAHALSWWKHSGRN